MNKFSDPSPAKSFKYLKVTLFFSLVFFSFITGNDSFSQTKVGYIDSKNILESMQESRDAKIRLDNLVQQWQTELKVLQDSLRLLKEDYDKKKLILTDQLKEQTELQIVTLENSISDFRIQKFGENGEYFRMQIEFMKPVQDRIFKAIETVAKEGSYDYVFDRSSEILLLYVNESHDLTGKVKRSLGIEN
jgi:outer membrane protein